MATPKNAPYKKKPVSRFARVLWPGWRGTLRKRKHGPQGKKAKKEHRKATHLRGYYKELRNGRVFI